MEEAEGIADAVLNEHAPRRAGDELFDRQMPLICQQDGGLLVA